MKKIYKILLIIVVVLTIFIIWLTLYKINMNKKTIEKEFNEFELLDNKVIDTEILDKEKYKDNIINDICISVDYKIKFNNEKISGKMFIGSDKYAYITDETNRKNHKISNVKFKTMYKFDDSIALNVYLISETNKLFIVSLYSNDINDTTIYELAKELEIESFTDIKMPNYGLFSSKNIVVLSKDGNMYDSKNGIRYTSSLILLDEIYYVYDDNTIANVYGNLLKDDKNNELKIKYYIEFMNNNRIFENAFSIIITEDNKILYTKENDTKLNIYNKTIKTLNYKVEENDKVKVNITFEDNTTMNFTGMYTEKYGFE